MDYLRAHGIEFKMARVDSQLRDTLKSYDLLPTIGEDNIYGNLQDAVADFLATPATSSPTA